MTAGLTLGTLAMALSVLGLGSAFARVGLGAGAAVAMLLGNPLSGLMSAPEMLPRGWDALDRLLPHGPTPRCCARRRISPAPEPRRRPSCCAAGRLPVRCSS